MSIKSETHVALITGIRNDGTLILVTANTSKRREIILNPGVQDCLLKQNDPVEIFFTFNIARGICAVACWNCQFADKTKPKKDRCKVVRL